MKAIEVKIVNRASKVVATVSQAIEFIQSKNVRVNTASEKHLETAFENVYSGNINKNGGAHYSFSAGNNSGNPTIWINDVTGKFSQSDLLQISKEANKIINGKYPELDLRLTFTVEGDYLLMEGGLKWYWSPSAQRHFAIEELWYKSKNPTLDEVVEYVDRFIARNK